LPDAKERAEWLWEDLEPLLRDDDRREGMKKACRQIAIKDAASKVAERVLSL
jgi:UDP-N-acetylglucosamine:LPS N-acetylglucosamine transferase